MLSNIGKHNRQNTYFGDATKTVTKQGITVTRQVAPDYEQRLLREFWAIPKTKTSNENPDKPKTFMVGKRYGLTLNHTQKGPEVVQENPSKSEKTVFSINEHSPLTTKILHEKLVTLLETL